MKAAYKSILLLLCLLLAGCSSQADEEKHSETVYSMDTIMELSAYGKKGEAALDAAVQLINSYEAVLSVTGEDSIIHYINENGCGEPDGETLSLLRNAMEISAETAGAFRIDLYELTSLWGFTTGEYRVPEQTEIDAVRSRLNCDNTVVIEDETVTLNGVKLDLGACAKGYTSQAVIDLWREQGIKSGIVSLGGNVQTLGLKPDGSQWKVGIRDPLNPSECFGILSVSEAAVVTSGGYQRYFEENGIRYSHIMDASTGRPAESGILSATIVSSDGFLSDCLSTAVYVMGVEKAEELWRGRDDFEMILVTADGTVFVTDGLSESFSCESFKIISRT